jgi:hypothetical protein
METPATALEAFKALSGQITGPEADAILASYFAPGPEPRFDTPEMAEDHESHAIDNDLRMGPLCYEEPPDISETELRDRWAEMEAEAGG